MYLVAAAGEVRHDQIHGANFPTNLPHSDRSRSDLLLYPQRACLQVPELKPRPGGDADCFAGNRPYANRQIQTHVLQKALVAQPGASCLYESVECGLSPEDRVTDD